jgi:hypothetical protein
MPKDVEELSAASVGSPCLSVWCRLDLSTPTDTRLEDDYQGGLWIKLRMPAALPVGSSVYLPTPLQWERAVCELHGRITEWMAVGELVVCEMDTPGSHFNGESVSDLLAIGYIKPESGCPDEVGAAYRKLWR